MRMIVDTHSLIWALDSPSNLSQRAALALQDPNNELLLSAASIWETAIKYSHGKLKLSLPYRQWLDKAIVDLSLTIVPVTVEYAERITNLPKHHKDPFDRMIIVQALVDKLPVICADPHFDAYGVPRIW